MQTDKAAALTTGTLSRCRPGTNRATESHCMPSRRSILRHAVISLSFLVLYLLLNRPEVILFSRIGFVSWYPAAGVVMALMLGISPWYALLACFADVFAGKVIYAQPVMSFSNTVGAVGSAICYGVAAYVLRGPLDCVAAGMWSATFS